MTDPTNIDFKVLVTASGTVIACPFLGSGEALLGKVAVADVKAPVDVKLVDLAAFEAAKPK